MNGKCRKNKAIKTIFAILGFLAFMAMAVAVAIKLIKRFCPGLLCELYDCDDDCCCGDYDDYEDDEDDEEDESEE